MTRQQFSDFLATQGATLLGRNTLRQPDVWDADLRLAKYFQLPRPYHPLFESERFRSASLDGFWVSI